MAVRGTKSERGGNLTHDKFNFFHETNAYPLNLLELEFVDTKKITKMLTLEDFMKTVHIDIDTVISNMLLNPRLVVQAGLVDSGKTSASQSEGLWFESH